MGITALDYIYSAVFVISDHEKCIGDGIIAVLLVQARAKRRVLNMTDKGNRGEQQKTKRESLVVSQLFKW